MLRVHNDIKLCTNPSPSLSIVFFFWLNFSESFPFRDDDSIQAVAWSHRFEIKCEIISELIYTHPENKIYLQNTRNKINVNKENTRNKIIFIIEKTIQIKKCKTHFLYCKENTFVSLDKMTYSSTKMPQFSHKVNISKLMEEQPALI